MKKINLLIAGAVLAAVAAGCANDFPPFENGAGTLRLNANVNSNVQIIRRVTTEQEKALAESAVIWISKDGEGLVQEFLGASNVPESLRLLSGSYTAEAWVGDSVPASWDATFYKSGFQPFTITAGQNTEVTLNCRVANTLASVSYSDKVREVLTNPVMTIRLADGLTDGSHTLEFSGDKESAKGRFMINSRTKGLVWSISGTQHDGSTFTKSDTIKNIQPATEYKLNVTYASQELVVGGAYFVIEVEEEPVGDESQINVTLPPLIVALEGCFDDNNTCRAQQGQVGRKSIFISAGCPFTDIQLNSSDIKAIIEGDGRVDLLNVTDAPKNALNAAGINWETAYDKENDVHWTRLNFEVEFTNSLSEAEHTFDLMVKDNLNHVSNATFTIIVSNDPVGVSPVQESSISYTSATLEGVWVKEATEYGFELREVAAGRSYEDWTRIPATVQGQRIYAVVTNLKDGQQYEYRVYADDFTTEETYTFATPAHLQLPNCGFEDWSTDTDGAYIPATSASSLFWDSGNHGSVMAKTNLTSQDSSIKHGGSYSAKLESKKATVSGIGKFAAGNIFIGKYLATDVTDGVLGWGRPFNDRPTAVKVWVRYEPKVVDNVKSNNADDVKSGDMDRGIIYVALMDGVEREQHKYDNVYWPAVVKTKSSGRQLFSKDQDGVIGYGERIFTEAVGGDTMELITIPINYKSDTPIANIILVASASKMGDYFTGGAGSTMWIDDIELVYE